MSTPYIYAWVEVRHSATGNWGAVVKADELITGMPYTEIFQCLFWRGMDWLGFEPVAPERGLPEDTSLEVLEAVRREDPERITHPSWISWLEIRDMDWDELSPNPDPRHMSIYARGPHGELIPEGSTSEKRMWHPGMPEEFEEEGKLYRYERITRRQAFEWSWGWPTLLKLMEVLAERFGADNVRLVVYFVEDV
jgi:hypothetical protein